MVLTYAANINTASATPNRKNNKTAHAWKLSLKIGPSFDAIREAWLGV